jgi:putative sigma-54 modulation protein
VCEIVYTISHRTVRSREATDSVTGAAKFCRGISNKGVEYMNLLITGQHVEITAPIREYVEKKLDRVIRHFDQIIEIAVILAVDSLSEKGRRQRAEVNLRVKGNVFHVEEFHEDMYAAIDGLVDKLDRQVLRYKSKIQDHQHESLKYVNSEL